MVWVLWQTAHYRARHRIVTPQSRLQPFNALYRIAADWPWVALSCILTSAKVQHTTNSIICYRTTKCLLHCSSHQNWNNDALMLVNNVYGALKQKVMVSNQEFYLRWNLGSLSRAWKRTDRERNGAISPHRNRTNFARNHAAQVMLTLCFDEWGVIL